MAAETDGSVGSVSIVVTTIGRDSLLATLEFCCAIECKEIIVVDDRKDARPLSLPRDSRIRIIEGPRLGWCGPARNAGIQAAVGDWILFCDDDDFLHPWTTRFLGELLLDAPRADVVCWRTMGRFDHVPWNFALPPRGMTELKRGLVCNAIALRRASNLLYGTEVLSHWVKPGFESATRHEHRVTMAPDDDFQLLQKALATGRQVVFAHRVAYGVQQPPPPHSELFPIVILRQEK